MKRLTVRLPDSIHRQLKALAERAGVSINHMVTIAVAEKTAALLTMDDLERRAARGDRSKLEAALAAIPDVEPGKGDQLPDAG